MIEEGQNGDQAFNPVQWKKCSERKIDNFSAEKEWLLAESSASKIALEENINTLEREKGCSVRGKKHVLHMFFLSRQKVVIVI